MKPTSFPHGVQCMHTRTLSFHSQIFARTEFFKNTFISLSIFYRRNVCLQKCLLEDICYFQNPTIFCEFLIAENLVFISLFVCTTVANLFFSFIIVQSKYVGTGHSDTTKL